jgi:hypothetical protein
MRTIPAVVKKRKKNEKIRTFHPVICHRCGEHSCKTNNLFQHYAPSDSGPTATRCPYTTEKFYLDGFSEEVYNICFNQEVAGIKEEQADKWARTIFYDPEREEEEGGVDGVVVSFTSDEPANLFRARRTGLRLRGDARWCCRAHLHRRHRGLAEAR